MEIYLNIKSLVDDIGSKFLLEAGTPDAIPPKGTVIQSINEANARMSAVIGKFLNFSYEELADDSLNSSDTLRFELALSPRKASGKAQPVATTMHSFIVNAALSKSFSSMGAADLSEKHDKQAISDAQVLNQLLNSKIPPI